MVTGSGRISQHVEYVDAVEREGAALVAAVRTDLRAPIACYPGWTNADLARHVGRIHRWATGIVAQGATDRPAMPAEEVPDDRVVDWLADAVGALAAALADAAPDGPVWTFDADQRTNAFWRRRMALETTLHRWDAERAIGRRPDVDPRLAHDGTDETLRVYMQQRLRGRDVGGDGQRVALRPQRGGGWTVRLEGDGIDVADGTAPDADATVHGTALDLWLLLCNRRDLTGLEVRGDGPTAALLVRAAKLVPGPAS